MVRKVSSTSSCWRQNGLELDVVDFAVEFLREENHGLGGSYMDDILKR